MTRSFIGHFDGSVLPRLDDRPYADLIAAGGAGERRNRS
jgi:hypothetical protein